jgi:hypothetical protein
MGSGGVDRSCKTWSKTTAKSHGLATWKENGNGGAKWRLASDKWRVASHLTEGKETAKGKNLRPWTSFIGEGKRDGTELGPPVGDGERTAEPWHGACFPVASQTSAWARSV